MQKIHRLGKKRNANRILQQLSPFLSSYREEYSTIYYLNALGRDYVNSTKIRKKTNFVQHVLMRNEFYIYCGFPSDWQNEIKLSDGENAVICDVWFKVNGKYNILEVDHLQTMQENRKKIERYRRLFENGIVKTHLGYLPVLNWLTTSELRKKKLIGLCKGLPYAVYTTEDIR